MAKILQDNTIVLYIAKKIKCFFQILAIILSSFINNLFLNRLRNL